MSGAPRIGIISGSDSDQPIVEAAERVLERFGIPFESKVLSAHRTPEATADYARTARSRGLQVLIAIAGLAAHLGGVIASHTTLPVLGVPAPGGVNDGLDALLAMVQMPAGVPVGTLAVGRHGGKNAALLAVAILALGDPALAKRLDAFKQEMAEGTKP